MYVYYLCIYLHTYIYKYIVYKEIVNDQQMSSLGAKVYLYINNNNIYIYIYKHRDIYIHK